MGEYMNSKGLVGLFKIKVALVTALLCSVSFPHQAIAAGVSAVTGDEILAGLKAGDVWFLLEGNRDISIPNPGEVFDQILYNGYAAPWIESSYALTFMGDVTFKDATFGQIYNAADKGPVTVFDGAVFKNKGTLAFSGESITFVDNEVQGIINFVENKKAASPLDGFGGAIYNTKDLLVDVSKKALFTNNSVTTGSVGIEQNASNVDEVRFKDTTSNGGAIYNTDKATALFESDVGFIDNRVDQYFHYMNTPNDAKYIPGGEYNLHSESNGGAIFNKGDMTFNGKTLFQENKALNAKLVQGGAIYNDRTGVINFNNRVDFLSNLSQTDENYAYGAAVFNNEGTINFNDQANFVENEASLILTDIGHVVGGAGIYTIGGAVNFNGTTEFKNNRLINQSLEGVARGAAAYTSAGHFTFKGNTLFEGNTISSTGDLAYGTGAGLHVIDKGSATFNGNTTFLNNKIVASTFTGGAAISNYGTINFVPENGNAIYRFEGNTIKSTPTANSFAGNSTNLDFIQARGGAIYNGEGAISFAQGTQVIFKNNKAETVDAKAYGGAIYNDVYNKNTGRISFSGDTTFEGNEAATGGGAIYNKGDLTLSGRVAFINNKTDGFGGGVYNAENALLTIDGSEVTFKGNKAALGSNIYNLGSVVIQNVKDTMVVDYEPYTNTPLPETVHTLFDQDGDFYNAGDLKIKNSQLQLRGGINSKNTGNNKEGTISFENSRIDLGENAIYADTVDIKTGTQVITHIGDKTNGHISANDINISANSTALNVVVDVGEIKEGETKDYRVLDAQNDINGSFAEISKNHLYQITEKEGQKGVYSVTKRVGGSDENRPDGPEEFNPVIPDDEANLDISKAWIDGDKITEPSDAAIVQSRLNALAQSDGVYSNDYQEALKAISPDASTLITAHAQDLARQISSAVDHRFYASLEKTHFDYNGKIHYRRPKNMANVWVQGLYNQSEYTGKQAWDMDTAGIVAGVDIPVLKDLKVGAAYAYSKGDGQAVARDVEIETSAGAVYAQWQPNRFYTNAFAMYGQSTVTEKRNVLSTKVEAEYDVDIMAGQVMAGYKLGPVLFGNWVSGVISPEAGLRYVYAKQNAYTDSLGQEVEGFDSHTLTGILGARYTVGYAVSPTIQWYPELRAALTYDFLSPETDNKVVLVNGANYTVSNEEMDKFGIEIGIRMGLEIDKRAEIGIEYEGLFKGDYTNHTGMANLKYNF